MWLRWRIPAARKPKRKKQEGTQRPQNSQSQLLGSACSASSAFPLRDTLLLVEVPSFFRRARSAQDVGQGVVALVTRVLVERLSGRRPGELAGPRSGPRLRIFDGEAVHQRLVVHAPEALDDVQLIG